VYSARYAGEHCSYQDNVNKMLNALKGQANRKAAFRTVIALNLNGEKHCFEGRCDGQITEEQHGTDGFGYDPIFQPDGFDQTFAEMGHEAKNAISHRGRATQKLIAFLKQALLAIVVFLVLSLPAQAQKVKKNTNASRPKIGLVMGGGGAKGASHIGVLKYLEELEIPIDYVAGTSMGSIMAGLYAMGYTPGEMEGIIANMNWDEYIGNKIDRSMMSYEMRKRRTTTLINVPFSLESLMNRNSNGSFVNELPSAYVNNSSLVNLFNDLCVGYQENMDFNELPIPFACVATDLVTGDEVVLRSGNVSTAIRASMAIPGVFSPVVIDDMVLVDGGLVNNFPADVLRIMGADIIIGVEITKDKRFTVNDLKSLPQLMSRLLANTTSAKRTENRDLCDVYIVPDVSGYGMLSFNAEAIDTLVNRGYRKAQEYHDQLLELKQDIDKKAGYSVTKTLNAPKAKNLENDSVLIRNIDVAGAPEQQNRWMIRKGQLKSGQYYSKNDIEKAINLYRGTGAFDEITYTVKESDSVHTQNDSLLSDMYDLNINMKPASPHVFGVGLHYDTDEGTGLLFNLGLNEKKFGGSKLNASAKLSYSPRVNITYTYSRASLANFNLAFDYKDDHYKWWVMPDKTMNMRYFQRQLTASVSQFHLLDLSTSVGMSYIMTGYDQTSLEGSAIDTMMFGRSRHFVPFVNVEYDNLDDAYFATQGFYGRLASHYYFFINEYGRDVFDLCFSFKYYSTFGGGDFTVIPQLYGRYAKDDLFPFLWNYYGGEIFGRHFDEQLPFVGSDPLTLTGPFATVLRCDLRYRFYGKHYLTGIFNVVLDLEDFYDNESGFGLKYSYNSFIGPVSLTAQWSEQRKKLSGYLSIGYYF
jgi:NTE family protein